MKTKNVAIWCTTIVLIAMIGFSGIRFRYYSSDKMSVTGLGEREFVSDLIVWSGSISVSSSSLIEGYNELERQQKFVTEYIRSQDIADSCIVYSFVNNYEKEKKIYMDGQYAGSVPDGYDLYQEVKIESRDVDKVEALSRNISQLIAKGINIQSQAPQYYYTELESLKLDIIAMATEDARKRAETIADRSKSKIDKLSSAKMGVFQIVGTNSNEAYSWGGNYNTTSKNKKATITMKLEYHVK